MRLLFLFLSLYTLTASAQKEYKVYSNDSSAYVVVDESAVFHRMGSRDDALAFYALRKRVYAAYPIEWLGKCDI